VRNQQKMTHLLNKSTFLYRHTLHLPHVCPCSKALFSMDSQGSHMVSTLHGPLSAKYKPPHARELAGRGYRSNIECQLGAEIGTKALPERHTFHYNHPVKVHLSRNALFLDKPVKAHLSRNALFFNTPGKVHLSLRSSCKSTPGIL
jgi:hypothetical protein